MIVVATMLLACALVAPWLVVNYDATRSPKTKRWLMAVGGLAFCLYWGGFLAMNDKVSYGTFVETVYNPYAQFPLFSLYAVVVLTWYLRQRRKKQ